MWLQSLFFSFLQCVFVTHPLLILLYSVYTACRYHGDMSVFDHHDDGIIAQPGELSPRRRLSSGGLSDEEINLQVGSLFVVGFIVIAALLAAKQSSTRRFELEFGVFDSDCSHSSN